jgi:hypothetical protein
MERNKDLKPSELSAPGFGPALVPTSAKEALIIRLFDHYSERYNTNRIETYLEDLADIGLQDVEQALQTWRRRPHHFAPSAGEIRALVSDAQEQRQKDEDKRRREREAEIPPTSARDVDAIYAQLLRESPQNTVLRERIAERARDKAQGKPLDGAAEVSALMSGIGGKGRL